MSLLAASLSLVEQAKDAEGQESAGFELIEPVAEKFDDVNKYRKALKDQKEAIAYVPATADNLHAIGLDGMLLDTDYRLTRAAFGDLCHFAGVPVTFARRLSSLDEGLAQEVFRTMIERVFHKTSAKVLVVDSRTDQVHGIVGETTYAPIDNADVFDFAMSAVNGKLHATTMWLCGPFMRMTAQLNEEDVNPGRMVQGKKVGDVVALGMSVENAIHGDKSVRVSDYAERLSCTNGMTSREADHSAAIRHQGDVEMAVAQAVLKSGKKVVEFVPLMKRAVTLQISDPGRVKLLKDFLSAPGNGGSKTLAETAIDRAVHEAHVEGQPQGVYNLWNVANGVNVQEHAVDNVHRKVQIETLAYSVLKRFGAMFEAEDAKN